MPLASGTGQTNALDSIDEMVVRECTMDLQSRPGIKAKAMSSHGIYDRVNALRSFFSWLHQQGYTEGRVLRTSSSPRLPSWSSNPWTTRKFKGYSRPPMPTLCWGP